MKRAAGNLAAIRGIADCISGRTDLLERARIDATILTQSENDIFIQKAGVIAYDQTGNRVSR